MATERDLELLRECLQAMRETTAMLERLVNAGQTLRKEPKRGELLTCADAAKILEISTVQFQRLVHQGKIPAVNIGSLKRGIYRINSRDLDDFMKGKCQAPAPAEPVRKRTPIPKNIKQYV